MTEETSTKNSKAVIVRRFCGFLLGYYFIIFFSLGCSGRLIDDVAHFWGYTNVDVSYRLFSLPGALFGLYAVAGIPIVWICGPLYILLSLFCFITKRKFIYSPSKIGFFHRFILLSSFIILLVSYLLGVQGENEDYFGLPCIFANLSVMILLIALTIKSTFCKKGPFHRSFVLFLFLLFSILCLYGMWEAISLNYDDIDNIFMEVSIKSINVFLMVLLFLLAVKITFGNKK